ncbi:MAG: alpha-amylase [Prevotella sp.]|nr:alpha-amylase [Prevotella sp.]
MSKDQSQKVIVYQVFTRLYGNRNTTRKENGTIADNGCGKMADFTPAVLKGIAKMGISHVWYTGVIRHATQTDYSQYGIPRQHPAVVKGKAGSPYAIADYYDIDPDLAVDVKLRMQEFEQLVQRTHDAGLKVIIDFVPNHVARQYKSVCKPRGVKDLGETDKAMMGFDPQNNFYYCPGQRFMPYFDLYGGEPEPYLEEPAKATGNDHFDNAPGQNDWYETVKLNYGVDYYAGRVGHFDPMPDTWKKMTDILLFWAKKGVDGFRCDMAEMVPAEFWAYATKVVKSKYKQLVFIGEVYNPGEYRHYLASGFDWLYDKVGMYDTMRAVICHHAPASAISHAWQATDDIRDHMLYFLENHDEQRVASDFFAASGWKGVPGMIASLLMQQNPFMLYAGEEYGERGMDREGFSGNDGRTTIFDYWSVDTLCRAAQKKLTADEEALFDIHQKTMLLARQEKAVTDGVFFDLMYVNGHLERQYAFLRYAEGELLLVVTNFEDRDVVTDVNIPAHAFDYLGIKEKKVIGTDLLTKEKLAMSLRKDGSVRMEIKARSGRVWKIKI